METEHTVHVVDDDPAVRRSLEQLLESAGFRSVIYETAPGFLDAAPTLTAGCVLLDIRMPEMDGLELQARLNRLGFRPSVIVMTGHGDVQTAVRAMKAGAVDFIEKPFDDERLIAAIEAALAGSGQVSRDTTESHFGKPVGGRPRSRPARAQSGDRTCGPRRVRALRRRN